MSEVPGVERGFPIPSNEEERLAVLRSYQILDTQPESCYDEVVQMIQRILDVPIVVLSFLDADRQWFKAKVGWDQAETSRGVSICTFAIMQSTPFVVEDASRDERFQSNPYVAGEPHLRFYAGIPLMTHSGLALGTICALDFHPRRIGYRELEIMSSVARLVVRFLDVRKAALEDPFTGRPLPERLRDTYNDAA